MCECSSVSRELRILTFFKSSDNDIALVIVTTGKGLNILKYFTDSLSAKLFHRACHQINWISTEPQRASNSIEHAANSSRLRSYPLNVRTKRGAGQSPTDHHLLVACLHFRAATESIRRRRVRFSLKSNTGHLRNRAVIEQCEHFFALQTTLDMKNPPEIQHTAAIFINLRIKWRR